MKKDETYTGIHNDLFGGMTDIGRIIRDAWAFGLLAETETCEGWRAREIESLWEKVDQQWEKYGFSVGSFPDDLRQRYLRIQEEAVERAKSSGWNPDSDLESE
jgi:hypothetical protein